MTSMSNKERHEKMNTAVTQIGRLIYKCAEHGLDQGDIVISMQTATSLLCEVNEIDIIHYMEFLYVLHSRRTNPDYDGSDESVVRAELAALFTPTPKDAQH